MTVCLFKNDVEGCTGEGRPSCAATECMAGVEPCHDCSGFKPIGKPCGFVHKKAETEMSNTDIYPKDAPGVIRVFYSRGQRRMIVDASAEQLDALRFSAIFSESRPDRFFIDGALVEEHVWDALLDAERGYRNAQL